MSDEVPITAAGAVRAYLSALGFIVALIGAEMLAEKEGGRLYLGGGLIAASLLIFLSAALWSWIQKKISRRALAVLVVFAKDPRWWSITLLALIAIFGPRLIGPDWTMGLGTLVIGAAYFLSRPNARTEIDVVPKFTSGAAPKDPQTERDLLLLLDFAVYQTTSELLDSLVKAAPLRILSEQLVLAAERYEESEKYLQQVRNKLADSHRMSEIANLLHNGEWQAEQQIRETPPGNRPTGIDPLDLRKWAIANRQCWLVHQYLVSQLAEVKEKIAGQRAGLVDQFRLRSP